MIDYLSKYVSGDKFDIPRLLNDDFFLAIKLTFNAGYYISAAKLLMCFIDTMAFLESGEGGAVPFKSWLDTHVSLSTLGVTSEEIWEHRNSLLHMSTLNSRRVRDGKVSRLVAYIGELPPGSPTRDAEAKWFDLYGLIQAVTKGIESYLKTMLGSPDSRSTFIARYDQILSDARYSRFENKSGS